jgi:DNA mismatch repair ATPase MutS
VLYQLLNAVLLLDIFWYLKINKWKEENEANLEEWFEVIGTIDTLMSIAGFAFSNPDYQYSEIADTPHTIRAEELGHPLINSNKRVSNNFDFSGKGGVCLITGSNMSGKSTFLRTVGINCVLGLMGAPVCAKSMQVGELKVFTSMRTQDDLEESVSSFYAELKRLKQLIGQIDEVRPTLFMIDEVLKGTNSDDRHKGATALIKQLNKTNAFGFVSTHDIVLGNMTNELAGVKNYSFNSTITGNEIHFNYKLTPGLCKSFNATKLMQLMGIEVE